MRYETKLNCKVLSHMMHIFWKDPKGKPVLKSQTLYALVNIRAFIKFKKSNVDGSKLFHYYLKYLPANLVPRT